MEVSKSSPVDPLVLHRRRFYIWAAAFRNLASGIEVTSISPSLWFYIQEFHSSNVFLGVVKSGFQYSSIVAVIVVGRIYDKTRRTKILVFFSNLAEIIGNVVYSLGFSQYLLVLGRLICGLGDGFTSVVYGEIGSVLPPSERLSAISLLEGGRIIGGVLGPCINFAFVKTNFYIGKWHITYGSSAGLVLFVLWIMVQCLNMAFIYDMYREEQHNVERDSSEARLLDSEDELDDVHPMTSSKHYGTMWESISELIKAEPLIVIVADTWFWLTYASGNALFPLALVEDLQWNPTQVTAAYAITGFITVIVIVSLQFLPKMDEVNMLIIACAFHALGEISRIVYQSLRPHRVAMTVIILLSSGVFCLFAGLSLVVGRTLLTRLIRVENQGFAQGVYNVAINLALIVGYLAGSSVLYHLDIWGSVTAFVYVGILFGLVRLKRRIHDKVEHIASLDPANDTDDYTNDMTQGTLGRDT